MITTDGVVVDLGRARVSEEQEEIEQPRNWLDLARENRKLRSDYNRLLTEYNRVRSVIRMGYERAAESIRSAGNILQDFKYVIESDRRFLIDEDAIDGEEE